MSTTSFFKTSYKRYIYIYIWLRPQALLIYIIRPKCASFIMLSIASSKHHVPCTTSSISFLSSQDFRILILTPFYLSLTLLVKLYICFCMLMTLLSKVTMLPWSNAFWTFLSNSFLSRTLGFFHTSLLLK